MIKHSVLIVTYNQEDYIEETILSILNQTELPYEIIILDDCSPDSNWDIIKKYQLQYPDLIKAYRNEVNLGLFPNMKKIRTLYTGNVVSYCSGDDLLEPDTIKAINEKIKQEGLDGENDRFIIVTNSVHLYPDGSRTVWNNYVERHINPIKTRLRYGLSYRSVGLSKGLLNATISEQDYLDQNAEVGYSADFFKGFEEVLNSQSIHYINVNGGVYRLNVGVTSAKADTKKWKGHQSTYIAVRDLYQQYFDKKDMLFIKFIIAADEFKIQPNLKNWINAFYYYLMNLGNFSYNNPAIRNLHYLLPTAAIGWLKFKVYPAYLILRNKFS
ncbi:MAG: hypothetical protein K0R36_2015 [Chryseobacterium sp.]|jgi:glycosyltransferase involved in cell wall biosynthesis|nr:hypothetical protein [Chryseobacterium sp.]